MRHPDDTPTRLVAAAERLFAEAGEEATSLRAIARAARSNPAAVHYHFGGRDELARAVLERHLGPLAARRLELLDAAAARFGQPIPVSALVEAALRPDLELLAKLRRKKVQVARFLGRAHTSSGPAVSAFLRAQFDGLADALVPRLRASTPDVDEAVLRLRLRLSRDALVPQFATAPDPGRPGPLGTDDVDEQVKLLVAFFSAGLSAAAPGPAILGTARRGDSAARSSARPRKRKKLGAAPAPE